MKIEKAKFTLRPWEPEDYLSLAIYANDLNVWSTVRDQFPHPYSEQDAKDFIALATGKERTEDLTIVIGGQAVGGVGFVPQTDVERYSAEIGYWLGSPYHGRGIMTEVVTAFSEYIFDNTEFFRLFAPVFGNNPASQRVLEKAGYRKVGILHKAAVKKGHVLDMHYYELVNERKVDAFVKEQSGKKRNNTR